jgi:hypothetical protein
LTCDFSVNANGIVSGLGDGKSDVVGVENLFGLAGGGVEKVVVLLACLKSYNGFDVNFCKFLHFFLVSFIFNIVNFGVCYVFSFIYCSIDVVCF